MALVKICPVCKNEFHGGEVFCPNDGGRLQSPSQMQAGAPPEKADPHVGEVIGDRYRVIRRIGEGGMGIVYEAEHVVIEKRVALKVLRDDFSSRPEVVQRFRQEAKSASRIGNEHIVDISDFGETKEGASYFVMELLEGEDLASVLEREGSIPLERAADILEQCGRALYAAHQKGIVHRDMKPENIFLVRRDDRPDFVKIVDFGIAKMSDVETSGPPGRKLTKTGMIFGTPEYMSPEQAAGKELDHRVDIYALGVIMFEMLTGRVPFVGDSFMGILTQHMFEVPPRLVAANPVLKVEPPIQFFVDRAMAKDPAERFQSCDEMVKALAAALSGEVVKGGTFVGYGEPVKYRPKTARVHSPEAATAEFELTKPKKANRGIMIGGIAVVGVVALGAVAVVGMQAGAGDREVVGPERLPATPEIASAPQAEPDAGAVEELAAAPGEIDAAVEAIVDAGPIMFPVRVVTRPEGARVWIAGQGDVCQETPCTFQARQGETITVRARQGRAEGELEITPNAETEITIPLVTPRRPSGGGGSGGREPSGGNGREPGGHGDLKIPDVFRRPR